MSQWYFFDLIDKYNIVFHSIFRDIYIKRLNKSTDEYDLTLRVPIQGENQTKRYMYEINRNIETVGAKLPMIGISDPVASRINEHSRPLQKSLTIKDKEDNEIVHRLPSPIPLVFTFEVSVWTEYAHDMNQIVEQILGNFSEIIVKPVNIIQDLSIYIEVPILLLEDVDNKSKFNSEIIDNFDHIRRTSFYFELYGYIFKPMQMKNIIKRTVFRGDEFKIISELGNSPNDLIDDRNNEFVLLSETLLNIFNYQIAENDTKYTTIIEDISDYLSSHGEYLEFKDLQNNIIIPYVFEYTNGEWYGSDELLPTNKITETKTGRVAFYVDIAKAGKLSIQMTGVSFPSYYDANDVFYSYNDFNKRHFNGLYISNKTSANYAYILNGALVTLFHPKDDIADAIKVIPKNSITQRLKEFSCSYINYEQADDTILFGLLDESGNYLYITGDYTLKEKYNDVVSTINVFTGIDPTTTLKIVYTFSATDIVVTINSETYTYVTSHNYVNCFMSGSQTLSLIDYFYARRLNE